MKETILRQATKFENIKEIIDVSKLDNPPAKAKLQPKHKEKIPRKLKKLKAQQT